MVLGLAVGGIVLLLRSLDIDGPLVASCTATDGDDRASLAPDQAANAALIAGVAVERGLPARAATIAIATAMQESKLRNIDHGDRDSLGLFQQRPSQGWGTEEQVMDPVYATNAFYDALVQIEGYQDLEITVAAQEVQRSAFPDAYAQHEPMARLFASALTGWSTAALSCRLAASEATDIADDGGALVELLARDLPSASVESDESGAVVTLPLGDAERSSWALAHWLVATADLTGVSEVAVGDLHWSRADDAEAGWTASEQSAEPGAVRVG